MEYKMKNVSLRNVSSSGSRFEATLAYDTIEMVYYQYDPITGRNVSPQMQGYNMVQMRSQ